MIIISQDKETIINFESITRISIIPPVEQEYKYSIAINGCLDLGYYKTKERAKEILQEIEKTYSRDILYIYETTKEAEREFWEDVSRYRGVTYNTEKRRIYFPGYATIYYKSINECKMKLDGYKFKEIQFRGESYGS